MEFNPHKLINKLGYQFTNPALLERALTHRSVCAANNERLEFLGDAVLSYIIAQALYRQLPNANEGQLTRLRANLVCKETLAELGDELELEPYLILGKGELKSGGARRESLKADAVEGIIGAIEQDGGLEPAKAFILRLFHQRLASVTLDDVVKDPKTQLQEFLQARSLALPTYEVVGIEGLSHDQQFQVECIVPALEDMAFGRGSSRRKAEQDAASAALQQLSGGTFKP